jgi:hypothetical protein
MSSQEKSKREIQIEEQLKNEQRIAKYEINQLHYKIQGQKDKNSANIGFLALVIFCLAIIVLGLA